MTETTTPIATDTTPLLDPSNPYYDTIIGTAIGYISGGINASHFQQALDLAKQHNIPITGISTAGNIVAAQSAFVAIVIAGINNGLSGVSNASFTTAIGTLAGTAGGPMAGAIVGGFYGAILDVISINVRENSYGGDAYDFQQHLERVLKDPEFWKIYNEHAEELYRPLLDPASDLGHWLGQNLPTPYDISQSAKVHPPHRSADFGFGRRWNRNTGNPNWYPFRL
jgi:hypothetical protein